MKYVLITGANGQLGLTFKDLVTNNDEYTFVFKTKTELDITNLESIKKTFAETKFDYCINCAAYTNVEQAEQTPEKAYQVNAAGVKNLAKLCELNQCILIHISTDYVFDGEKQTPYTINDIPNPINEYGKSKLLGEHYIQQIMSRYVIIRASWLYSKKHGKNFYRTILAKALAGEDLKVTDTQIGSPTHTESLVQFILKDIFQRQKPYSLHHFCDAKPMTWFGFAYNILVENNLNSKVNLVKYNKYSTFAQRPKYSVLEINKKQALECK